MITTAVEQLVIELKTMPYTMLVMIALLGYAGYSYLNHASAGDIQKIAEKVDKNTESINQVLILQLSESLRNLQRQRCATDDRDARRTLSRTIDDLQSNYRRLTGERFPLQSCE